MDIEDIKKIVNVAKTENLQHSAHELHITAGALSKIIKKVENSLDTQLFERAGRNIKVNDNGKRFVHYANTLVHEFEQLTGIFSDVNAKTTLNVCGPSILVDHWFNKLIAAPSNDQFTYKLASVYEGEAVKNVLGGHAHIGFVTREAITQEKVVAQGLEYISLGKTQFKLALAPTSPAAITHPDGKVTTTELLAYGFACPVTSPFCGVERGVGSDGWRDDKVARKIVYRCDDLSTLLILVRQGAAIAYLPDYIITSQGFKTLEVVDCHFSCIEEIGLIYKPSMAHGWLNALMENVSATVGS